MAVMEEEGGADRTRSISDRFRELASDTAVYGLTNALSKSVAVVLVPIYTRVLTPAEFGILDILLVTSAFVGLFMHLELHSALARYFYGYPEPERPAVVSTLLWTVGALGSAVALVGLALAGPVATWAGDATLAGHIRIVVATALASAVFGMATLQLRLERRSVRYGVVYLFNILVSVGLSILLVVGFRWGIRGALWGQFGGTLLGAILALVSVRHYLRPVFRPALVRRSLRFSLPTTPGLAAGWIRRYADRWVILLFLSTDVLGVYALGAKVAMIPQVVVQSLRLSWLPFSMSLLGDVHQREIYARSLRYYVLVLGSLAVAVAGASPELIALFAPSTYRGAETVVGWLTGAAIVGGAGMVLWVGAMVKERTAVSSIASWAGALGALGAMSALVPLFGIEGAAIAVFVGSLVQITVMFQMSSRLFPIHFAVGPSLAFVGGYVVYMGLLYAGDALAPGTFLALRAAGAVAFMVAGYLVLLEKRERVRLGRAVNGRIGRWRARVGRFRNRSS